MFKKLVNKFKQFQPVIADKKVDVVIHIGGPKTGTSALQKFCVNNHEKLNSNGIYYPVHNLDKNGVSGGHWELGRALLDGDIGKAKSIATSYLENAKAKNCVLLLSSESYWGLYEELPKLFEGNKVSYLAFVRHPLDSMLSNYNQLIKRHLGILKIDEYLNRQILKPSKGVTGEVLQDWNRSVGKSISVFSYSAKSFGQTGIYESLLNFLGLNSNKFVLPSRKVNISYPYPILEFKRLINRVLDSSQILKNSRIDVFLQGYSDRFIGKDHIIDHVMKEDYNSAISIIEPIVERLNSQFKIKIASDVINESRKYSLDMSTIAKQLIDVAQEFKKTDSYSYVSQRILETLASGRQEYEVFKLADLLDVKLDASVIYDELLSDQSFNLVVGEDAELADVLRELAKLYERNGKKSEALALISRAMELRPKGPFIIKMRERLQIELKKHLVSAREK